MKNAQELDLTIFLLRSDRLADFEKHVVSANQAHALASPLDGVAIVFPDTPEPPSWMVHISALLTTPTSLDGLSQAPSALVLVKRGSAAFVLSFGHGWQKLRQGWLEADFGRHIVLNLIKRNELVEVRSEQVFARWHLASERAPRPASVDEFGIEFDRDLVEVVEGRPKTERVFGKTIRGGTSLRARIDMSKLGPRLDRALAEFKSDAYKKEWPEVDNLQTVHDDSTRALLDGELDAKLQDKKALLEIVLFTPASRRGESIAASSYVVGRMSASPAHRPYLAMDAWFQILNKKSAIPSSTMAKATAVHIFDGDKKEIGVRDASPS
jgi:uncharacterized protein (TIGR04141 family)